MLTAAVLGLGRWGSALVDAVQGRSEKIRFKSAVVRAPQNYAEPAERYRIAVGDDYDAVLADPEIDAVVIATPHTQHAGQAIRAAEAGKHVLCEKPFAVTGAEARRVFAASEAAGVVCVVGFQRRFLAPYREIAKRLAAGGIGRVFHVECNQSAPAGFRLAADDWRTRPNEFRGGGIGGHGIHMIDSMIGLFGRIKRVDATARRHILDIDLNDTTFVLLDFENGMTGYLGTLLATAPVHRLQAFGDKGWVEMHDHRFFELQPLAGPREVIDFEASELERAELECFADVIAGKASFPVTREQALHGQAVFDAIAASVDGGRPVDVA